MNTLGYTLLSASKRSNFSKDNDLRNFFMSRNGFKRMEVVIYLLKHLIPKTFHAH